MDSETSSEPSAGPDGDDASSDPSRSAQWYRRRWKELEDILSTDDPDDVVARVRELQLDALQDQAAAVAESDLATDEQAKRVLTQVRDELERLHDEMRVLQTIRTRLDVGSASEAMDAIDGLVDEVQALREQQSAFEAAGFQGPDQALAIIQSMEEQLDQLYGEKESTLRTESLAEDVTEQGDTFEQLQALLAREEKLQRELGVSSSDEIIEMVNGLVDQLEDLYDDRTKSGQLDGRMDADSPNGMSVEEDADPFERLQQLLEREKKLQQELGVSDPDEVVTMVEGLSSQLDDLYSTRERLAEINLDDADSVIDMVTSMQEQLEVLYENQERMSAQGIHGVDHALSMIESMEEQLSQLYEERQIQGDGSSDARLDRMKERLDSLQREKEALLEKRKALEAEKSTYEDKMDTLEQNVGTADPDAIAQLIESMEQQLSELYADRELPAADGSIDTDPVVTARVLDRLDDASPSELNDLSAGAFCVDDDGTVHRANPAALRWPSLDADSPAELEGDNFFFDLAPSTNNSLFRGRFVQASQEGTMDVRFPYTYVSRRVPLTTFIVHLYRSAPDAPCWILFRPVDAAPADWSSRTPS